MHRKEHWSTISISDLRAYEKNQVFELVTGQPPFDSIMGNKELLVNQMIDSIGELPEEWQSKHALRQTQG